MKQKSSEILITEQAGFTLIEMLVVLGIFAVVIGLVIANFADLRGPRDLRIAQNELSSNIRKIQSYVFSSRLIPVNGSPSPKFYLLDFKTSTQSLYTVAAIDTAYTVHNALETINFPKGIGLSNQNAILVTDSEGVNVAGSDPLQCVQIALALPFGRIYVETRADLNCNFVASSNNPGYLASIANRIVTIRLKDSAAGGTRTVTLNGVTGTVILEQ